MKPTQFKFWMMVILIFTFMIVTVTRVFAVQNHPVGKVIAIRGNVMAQGPDLNSRKLFLKAPIFLHDTIKTKQGRIQLMFEDNTLITLGKNTEMEIIKYAWKPGDTDSIMETQIHEGSFRIMGGAITSIAPDNFKTHSSSGTIGIRGSMYAGMVKGSLLTVLFQGGKGIYVKNDAGVVNIQRPGFGTKVKSKTRAPEKPTRFTSKELIELENALAITTEKEPLEDTGSPEDTEPLPSEPTASQEDTSTNDDPLTADPAPVDTSSITDDIVLNSTQTNLYSSLSPTGTQQTILSMLLDLGFTGSESTAIPGSGIWVYTGKADNTLTNEIPENMKFIVNWDNQRIIAFEDNSSDTNKTHNGFGFGNVNASGSITDINIFGSGGDENSGIITAMTGSETFGHFYGSLQEALGIAVEGYDYNIQDQTQKTFWSDIVAATLDNKKTNTESGTETWKGFYVGIAEDMSSPDTNRRIFYNASPDNFTLIINKDNGTVSGTMSGKDFNNVNNLITGLTIGGGPADSVYIADKLLAASLSGNNVITINSQTAGLKPYGNFMVTSRTAMLSNYTTWGYWEVAYAEPGTGKDYHLHVPGAKWIAGKQTLATAVNSRIATAFTGTYAGKAEGVMFNNTSQMTEMTNGITSLNIDFAPGASIPVSGNISFDQINLPVTSTTGNINPSGFNAAISSAMQSNVNGTFFGPSAEALGGNFSAKMADGMHYHGIFAGDLQP